MTKNALTRLACFILLALPGALSAASADAAETQVPASAGQVKLSFAPLVERVAPSVVNLYTYKEESIGTSSALFEDPFFRDAFSGSFGRHEDDGTRRVRVSIASGVIISADGIIVTNHHVVDSVDKWSAASGKAIDIVVALNDQREFIAQVLLADERTDLAVLRITPSGAPLKPLPLGDSSGLKVGDLVLAVGNAFGVGQTVTGGIISALERLVDIAADERISGNWWGVQALIQTDASVNPGNSGGALVSMDGKLIGINASGFGRGGSTGVNFAVPSEMVRRIVEAAVSGRPVMYPWLGASVLPVTPAAAESAGMARPAGAVVETVYPGGPAEKAGLRPGDIITAIDGREAPKPGVLRFRIASARFGAEARLAVLRGGRRIKINLPLEPPPETPPRSTAVLEGGHPFNGVEAANLNPALAAEMQINSLRPGVVIIEVLVNSPLARSGVRKGDVVLKLNGEAVNGMDALRRVLAAPAPADSWRIELERAGHVIEIAVRP
ncbi:MAG: trypsin-like peptidase domain-containing protein [Rhodospirillales bacterium]